MKMDADSEKRKDARAILKARTKAFAAAVKGLGKTSPNVTIYCNEVSRMRIEFRIDDRSCEKQFPGI